MGTLDRNCSFTDYFHHLTSAVTYIFNGLWFSKTIPYELRLEGLVGAPENQLLQWLDFPPDVLQVFQSELVEYDLHVTQRIDVTLDVGDVIILKHTCSAHNTVVKAMCPQTHMLGKQDSG